MKFRRKPIIVEAFQYNGKKDLNAAIEFIGAQAYISWYCEDIQFKSDHGPAYASPGDWIVKTKYGCVYPVRKEFFELAYERAEDESTTSETETAAGNSPQAEEQREATD